MLTRKQTAWRKNRKLGDIQGGRLRVKREDTQQAAAEIQPFTNLTLIHPGDGI